VDAGRPTEMTTTPCPCPRPEGLSDEAVRTWLRAYSDLTDLPATLLPARSGVATTFHIVEWRRCGASLSHLTRCVLPAGHSDEPGRRGGTAIRHQYGQTRWYAPPAQPLHSEHSWPVPCWVTTAAEAERWRGEGEAAATSAPVCICNPAERCSECSPELRGSTLWAALSANLREMEATPHPPGEGETQPATCAGVCETRGEPPVCPRSCDRNEGHPGPCWCGRSECPSPDMAALTAASPPAPSQAAGWEPPGPKPSLLHRLAARVRSWWSDREGRWRESEAARIKAIRDKEMQASARRKGGEVEAVNRALVTGTLGIGTGGLPID
jgi:hypothetical protein